MRMKSWSVGNEDKHAFKEKQEHVKREKMEVESYLSYVEETVENEDLTFTNGPPGLGMKKDEKHKGGEKSEDIEREVHVDENAPYISKNGETKDKTHKDNCIDMTYENKNEVGVEDEKNDDVKCEDAGEPIKQLKRQSTQIENAGKGTLYLKMQPPTYLSQRQAHEHQGAMHVNMIEGEDEESGAMQVNMKYINMRKCTDERENVGMGALNLIKQPQSYLPETVEEEHHQAMHVNLTEGEAEEHHKLMHVNMIEGEEEQSQAMQVNMKYVTMLNYADEMGDLTKKTVKLLVNPLSIYRRNHRREKM